MLSTNPYRSFVVKASAGTGKTYLLSHRFLHLVAAHAPVSEILTVTFTKKATQEMRERILSLAETLVHEGAEKGEIAKAFDTEMARFHRSCAQALPPPLKASQVGMEIVSQAQSLKVTNIDSLFYEWLTIFASYGYDIPYPFRVIDKEESNSLREQAWEIFWEGFTDKDNDLIKDYGVYDIRSRIEIFKPYWQEYEKHPVPENSLTAEKIAEVNREGERFFYLAKKYESILAKLKKSQSKLEFSDLLFYVSKILAEDDGALYFLHQKISHLMLDEFQDTDYRQWQIFNTLSQELLAGENLTRDRHLIIPSVFIVGDSKQSIYGFRGASPDIMQQAEGDLKKFSPQIATLEKNYRSQKHLVDFQNLIFPHFCLDDYQPQTADTQESEGEIILALHKCEESKSKQEKRAQEAAYVASHVSYLLQQNISASDICILYRNATHAQIYADALQTAGVKYRKLEDGG